MGAENIHEGHQEGRPHEQESATALGELAVQDGAVAVEQPGEPRQEDEKRWDLDRAQTMAAVMRTPEQGYRSIDGDLMRVDKPFTSVYERARYDDESWTGQADQKAADQNEERRDAFHERLQDPEMGIYEKRDAQEGLENLNEKMNDKVDQLLSPFLKLYDMNPDKFAVMSTREFMDEAKAYDRALSDIYRVEFGMELLSETTQNYKAMLKESKGAPYEVGRLARSADTLFKFVATKAVRQYSEKLPDAWGEKPRAYDSAVHHLEKMFEDSVDEFTMSPKAIIEKHLELLGELTRVGEESLAEINAKKQDIEDKAKSSPEPVA